MKNVFVYLLEAARTSSNPTISGNMYRAIEAAKDAYEADLKAEEETNFTFHPLNPNYDGDSAPH